VVILSVVIGTHTIYDLYCKRTVLRPPQCNHQVERTTVGEILHWPEWRDAVQFVAKGLVAFGEFHVSSRSSPSMSASMISGVNSASICSSPLMSIYGKAGNCTNSPVPQRHIRFISHRK